MIKANKTSSSWKYEPLSPWTAAASFLLFFATLIFFWVVDAHNLMAKHPGDCVMILVCLVMLRGGVLRQRDLFVAQVLGIAYTIAPIHTIYTQMTLYGVAVVLILFHFLYHRGKPLSAVWGMMIMLLVFSSFWLYIHWIWKGHTDRDMHAIRIETVTNMVAADNLDQICEGYTRVLPKYTGVIFYPQDKQYIEKPVCLSGGEDILSKIPYEIDGLKELHDWAISQGGVVKHGYRTTMQEIGVEKEEKQIFSADAGYVGYFSDGQGRFQVLVDEKSARVDEERELNAMRKLIMAFSLVWFGIGTTLVYLHQRILNAKIQRWRDRGKAELS